MNRTDAGQVAVDLACEEWYRELTKSGEPGYIEQRPDARVRLHFRAGYAAGERAGAAAERVRIVAKIRADADLLHWPLMAAAYRQLADALGADHRVTERNDVA